MNEATNRGGLAKSKSRHSLALGEWLILNCPACALYRPHDPDQQDRADKPCNQVADPSPKVDPKETQNGAGNRRPDDTEHDIHQDPHFTLHELFCQPACNSADDDGCDPAYSCVVHSSSPRKARLVNFRRLVMFKLFQEVCDS